MFFREWETSINKTVDIPARGTSPTVPREIVQIAHHKYFLDRAQNLIARWSSVLTPDQVEEFINFLEDHRRAPLGLLSKGSPLPQPQYDFFPTSPRNRVAWISDHKPCSWQVRTRFCALDWRSPSGEGSATCPCRTPRKPALNRVAKPRVCPGSGIVRLAIPS